MAVSHWQIHEYTPNDMKTIRKMEKRIDKYLLNTGYGKDYITYSIPNFLSDRLIKYITKLYIDAGWDVQVTEGTASFQSQYKYWKFTPKQQ